MFTTDQKRATARHARDFLAHAFSGDGSAIATVKPLGTVGVYRALVLGCLTRVARRLVTADADAVEVLGAQQALFAVGVAAAVGRFAFADQLPADADLIRAAIGVGDAAVIAGYVGYFAASQSGRQIAISVRRGCTLRVRSAVGALGGTRRVRRQVVRALDGYGPVDHAARTGHQTRFDFSGEQALPTRTSFTRRRGIWSRC